MTCLPFYRCVDEGITARWMQPSDLTSIGGDAELAGNSLDRHNRLMAGDAGSLRLLAGIEQPTMQSLSVRDGVLSPLMHTCIADQDGRIQDRVNFAGDDELSSADQQPHFRAYPPAPSRSRMVRSPKPRRPSRMFATNSQTTPLARRLEMAESASTSQTSFRSERLSP